MATTLRCLCSRGTQGHGTSRIPPITQWNTLNPLSPRQPPDFTFQGSLSAFTSLLYSYFRTHSQELDQTYAHSLHCTLTLGSRVTFSISNPVITKLHRTLLHSLTTKHTGNTVSGGKLHYPGLALPTTPARSISAAVTEHSLAPIS